MYYESVSLMKKFNNLLMKYTIKVHDGHDNSHESQMISSRNIYLHKPT